MASSSEHPPVALHRRRDRFAAFLVSSVRVIASLPARALLILIIVYRRTLSPVLPVVFGAGCGCRFSPTCSDYAAGAIREHGAVHGGLLAIIRLLKCSPWHRGGFDPVPPRNRAHGFSCLRVARSGTAQS